jgi:hypothetical protein
MEDLKRLVSIITKRKQRQYPLLELKSINENSSKENIFFRYIKKGIVNTDDDASKLIYGTKSDDDRFRMLKSRLKQKLLNHLFFLDFTENNQKVSNQFEQECIQQLHQAHMLMFTGEFKIAKSLVLKALTTAERCEFTKYIVNCLEELVRIYSDNCQPHLFDDVIKNLQKTRELYAKEEAATEHYYYIKMMIVKSVNSRKKNLETATKSIAYLEKVWADTKSYNVFQYLLSLMLLHKELVGDFAGIIPILEEVESGKFQNISLNKNRLEDSQIISSMAFAYFRAKEYKNGMEYVQKNKDVFDPVSMDWFNFYEVYFLLSVYNKDYSASFEIVDTVFESKYFDKIQDEIRDKWKLYNAYVHLIQSGSYYLKNNYSNILDKIPEYDKDKEGFNAAVLILQFMYYVEQRESDKLVEIRNELKSYMSNHFKENFSYRSRTFYKLVNIVVENELDFKSIQLKSRYLIKKLAENQIVGNAFTELEIVPYEHLWDMIFNKLKYHEVRSF